MRKKFLNQSIVSRRDFLKGVTLTNAAALTTPALSARAQQSPTREPAKVVPQPNLAAETQPPPKDPATQSSSGGDFMAEVLNTLDIDYMAMNCASSFRGLHEAIINHTRNKPEILTCPHEEIAVSMAQGYAKIEGKPMAMICHGVVGLQHATMAIYNSWCDRVPVYIMIGNIVEAHHAAREQAKADATIGWDASPITTARMCAELYAQIKAEDWSLVGNGIRITWPNRLWNFDKSYRWNGGSGGAGIGYTAPASTGAALANKKHGRISVAIQGDGDLMFVPGTLWTAAHHRIPILYVVHNNRAYHQEYMYLQAMANRQRR